MTENQEDIEFSKFYNSIARYYKEGEEMIDLRKENTHPDETTRTFLEAELYHEVLDSANIPYPLPIERSLQILRIVSNLQEQIEEIKNDR